MNNLIKSLIVVLVAAVAVLQAKPIAEKGFVLTKGLGDAWSNCSKAGDAAKILSVTLDPDPPKRGKDLTVTATFTLSENVTSGKVAIKVKDGIIPILDKTLELCDIAKQAGVSCPVPSGTHTVKLTEAIPNIPAHAKGNAEVTDQNGKELACINIDVKI